MVDEDIEREERAIYSIVIVALAPVVIVAALRRVNFDGGTSLCLLFVIPALVGLAATVVRARRPRIPRARALDRRDRASWRSFYTRS
jgi:hypothetical protein